jgi:hypothetical protein
MRTERLIEVLSTNLEPVKRGQLWRALVWALVVGVVAAFLVMLATVGVRFDFGRETHWGFMALKLLFTLSLIGKGTVSRIRSMSPGRGSRKPFWMVFLPFLVISSAGLVALALAAANPESCTGMMMGMRWQTCLLCITALRCYTVRGTHLGIAPGCAHQFDSYWCNRRTRGGSIGCRRIRV